MAVALLERGLRAAGDDAIRATQLLAPLVDARLACGDVPGAAQAAGELAELAAALGDPRCVAARADLAAARVARAAGRTGAAAEPARRALAGVQPARACRSTRARRGSSSPARWRAVAPDVARDEARTALATFRELGASRAMDAAAAVLLRELGAGDRRRVPAPRRADRARAGGAGAAGDGHVERADRPDARRSARRPPATTSAASSPSSACATGPRRRLTRPRRGGAMA